MLAMSVPDAARNLGLPVEEAAARVMGMPPHELTSVEQVSGGYLIHTKDGLLTLVGDDGSKRYGWSRAELGLTEPVPAYDEPVDEPDDDQYVDLPAGANLDGVPDGTAKDVLDWVDGDPEKARLALEAEIDTGSPRTSLVAKLERLVG